MAQRGYSRDHRSDCKQVNVALVVSRRGMPLGYELFPGNTADVSTVEDMVEHVEGRYGKANRIWVMDRGMASQENMKFRLCRPLARLIPTRHPALSSSGARGLNRSLSPGKLFLPSPD